jgi:hypothetical protein
VKDSNRIKTDNEPCALKARRFRIAFTKILRRKQENSGAIHFSMLTGLLNLLRDAGNMKFNTQNEELLIVLIITFIILPEYFCIRLVQ